MCRDVSNNDTEELFAQRIFEIYTFAKFSNQILNHVTVFKEEVNSIKEFRKEEFLKGKEKEAKNPTE